MTLILSTKQKAVANAIYDEAKALGWSHVACCGLLAMAVGESSLDPAAVSDHDHSFGLWQIQDVASVLKGIGINLVHDASPVDQSRAVDFLLRHSEHAAGAALRDATSVTGAATVLVNLFERPANKLAAVAKRVPYAVFFDKMFSGESS